MAFCSPDGIHSSDERPGGVDNVKTDMQEGLRAHPLFFAISMGLLAEIINSRYFSIQLFVLLGKKWSLLIITNCYKIINFVLPHMGNSVGRLNHIFSPFSSTMLSAIFHIF